MNRYYTATIPYGLAQRLKEKGMPIETEGENIWCPSYAECFDWFAERGLNIVMENYWDFAKERITDMWDCYIVKVGAFSSQPKNAISQHDTWHEAAIAAINKALELI